VKVELPLSGGRVLRTKAECRAVIDEHLRAEESRLGLSPNENHLTLDWVPVQVYIKNLTSSKGIP